MLDLGFWLSSDSVRCEYRPPHHSPITPQKAPRRTENYNQSKHAFCHFLFVTFSLHLSISITLRNLRGSLYNVIHDNDDKLQKRSGGKKRGKILSWHTILWGLGIPHIYSIYCFISQKCTINFGCFYQVTTRNDNGNNVPVWTLFYMRMTCKFRWTWTVILENQWVIKGMHTDRQTDRRNKTDNT